MQRMELLGRRIREKPKRGFMDTVREDMQVVGMTGQNKIEKDNLLWQSLMGVAER